MGGGWGRWKEEGEGEESKEYKGIKNNNNSKKIYYKIQILIRKKQMNLVWA